MRMIALLAVGLVLATMSAVAAVAHTLVGGLPWAAAFTLGAIVAPTDPLAATAIARRLGLPRRMVAVLEGESRSTTRPRWSPTAWRWPPSWPGAPRGGRPACGSWPARWAAWRSGWRSGG
jgi:hypothetical protein